MTRPLIILFTILITTNCSIFDKKNSNSQLKATGYSLYSQNDFIDHLNALESAYLKNSDIQQIALSKQSHAFLKNLEKQIKNNNELIFLSRFDLSVKIIKSPTPFYFSLPSGTLFISSGVIQKYIKNEELLTALMAFELIKIEKKLYRKNVIIPVGYVSTDRLISLTRLGLPEKNAINKWAYYILNRSGFDSSQYLSWIQIQNKNTLDFLLHLGDAKSISREESMLKTFITKRNQPKRHKTKSNSSKGFYAFVKEVRNIKDSFENGEN